MNYLSKIAHDHALTLEEMIDTLLLIKDGQEQIDLIEDYLIIRQSKPTYLDKNYIEHNRRLFSKTDIVNITANLNDEAKDLIIKAFAFSNYSLYKKQHHIEQFHRIRKVILNNYSIDDIAKLVSFDSKNPKFYPVVFQTFVAHSEKIEKLLQVLKEQHIEKGLKDEKNFAFSLLNKIMKESTHKKSLLSGINAFEKVFNMSFLEYDKALYVRKPYPTDILDELLQRGGHIHLNKTNTSAVEFLHKHLQGNNLNQCKTIIRYIDLENETARNKVSSLIEYLKSGQTPTQTNYPKTLIQARKVLGCDMEKILLELAMEKNEKADKISTIPTKKIKI